MESYIRQIIWISSPLFEEMKEANKCDEYSRLPINIFRSPLPKPNVLIEHQLPLSYIFFKLNTTDVSLFSYQNHFNIYIYIFNLFLINYKYEYLPRLVKWMNMEYNAMNILKPVVINLCSKTANQLMKSKCNVRYK